MGPERCVCCNAVIPEGRQVCPRCMNNQPRKKRKIMRKICYWILSAVEWILLFLLVIVMAPLAMVDELLRKLHRKDPERMTDQERREYYGYDKGW